MQIFLTGSIVIIFTAILQIPAFATDKCDLGAKLRLDVNGVDATSFANTIDLFKKIYSPIFNDKFNCDFKIAFDCNELSSWNPLSDWATPAKDHSGILLHPGFGTTRGRDLDVISIIFCHEIGHILGGAPIAKDDKYNFSHEGEADYYATAACGKVVFSEIMFKRKYSELQEQEKNQVASRLEQTSLKWVQGMSVPSWEKDQPKLFSLATTDDSTVSKIVHWYPQPRCRLETLKRGARCPLTPELIYHSVDPSKSGCQETSSSEEIRAAARPRCWFVPFDESPYP